MVKKAYVPERGDIVFLQFSPQSGREHRGRRPALVLSPSAYNRKAEMALFCPITSRKKGYPFEVELPDDFPVTGVVLSDQVRSLDWKERKADFCRKAPAEVTAETIAKIEVLLG